MAQDRERASRAANNGFDYNAEGEADPRKGRSIMSHATLFVGTVGEGVWRSTDGGAEWTRSSKGMFVECDVRSLAVDPRDPRLIYAGTNEGVYLTKNAGDDWVRLEGPLDKL